MYIYRGLARHKNALRFASGTLAVLWVLAVGKDSLGRLRDVIKQTKPTFVLISLGSNDLFTKEMELYERYLDNILKQLVGTKFVWICPPNWKEDFGLTDLIAQKVGTERFFPSKALKIPRAGDKIHPTVEGYNRWADSLSHWLMNESQDKILMHKKEESKQTPALPAKQDTRTK